MLQTDQNAYEFMIARSLIATIGSDGVDRYHRPIDSSRHFWLNGKYCECRRVHCNGWDGGRYATARRTVVSFTRPFN